MKIRFVITLISILLVTVGCQTIQNKTNEVVEKENKKYGLFVGGELSLMLSSFKKTSPSSGFTTPDKILTRVDLPAPFSPNNAYILPLPNSNDTLSFAIHPG